LEEANQPCKPGGKEKQRLVMFQVGNGKKRSIKI